MLLHDKKQNVDIRLGNHRMDAADVLMTTDTIQGMCKAGLHDESVKLDGRHNG